MFMFAPRQLCLTYLGIWRVWKTAAITLPFSQNLIFFLICDLGLEMDLNFQVIKLEENIIYYYYYSFAVFFVFR